MTIPAPSPNALTGISWSGTYPLTSGHHLELGRRPGVYRIRVFTRDGRPVPIPRLNGIDELGILHIGHSEQLGLRVRVFRQAAEGLKAPHPAGRQFHQWGFASRFRPQDLRFDYVITIDKADAIKLERHLHEEYRLRYLDKPPLDAQSGQSTETPSLSGSLRLGQQRPGIET